MKYNKNTKKKQNIIKQEKIKIKPKKCRWHIQVTTNQTNLQISKSKKQNFADDNRKSQQSTKIMTQKSNTTKPNKATKTKEQKSTDDNKKKQHTPNKTNQNK